MVRRTLLQDVEDSLADAEQDFDKFKSSCGRELGEGWEEKYHREGLAIHELMDRTALLGLCLDTALAQHPSATASKELFDTIYVVGGLLARAYIMISDIREAQHNDA